MFLQKAIYSSIVQIYLTNSLRHVKRLRNAAHVVTPIRISGIVRGIPAIPAGIP